MADLPTDLDTGFAGGSDSYLGSDLLSDAPDQADAALGAAVLYIERETGVRLQQPGTVTWYIDGGGALSGRTRLWLPQEPSAVMTVEEFDSFDREYEALTVDEDFVVEGDVLRRIDGRSWSAGNRSVRVTATAGYAAASDLPADQRDMIYEYAAAVIRGRSADRPVVTDAEAGGAGARVSPQWWRGLKQMKVHQGLVF